MRKTTTTVLGLFALTVLLTGNAFGQEKKATSKGQAKAKADDKDGQQKKIEQLTKELEELQKQLSKTLRVRPLETPDLAGRPQKGTLARIAKLEAELKKVEKKDGAKSKAARGIRKQIADLKEEAAVLGGGLLDPAGNLGGLDTAQLYSKEGRGAASKREPDQLSKEELELKGQQLVTRGQELKMIALAKKVLATQDETLKSELTRELHKTAKEVKESREQTRAKQIEQLQEQIKMLKAQGNTEVSPEEVVKRLLDGGKDKKDKKDKKDAPKKEKK